MVSCNLCWYDCSSSCVNDTASHSSLAQSINKQQAVGMFLCTRHLRSSCFQAAAQLSIKCMHVCAGAGVTCSFQMSLLSAAAGCCGRELACAFVCSYCKPKCVVAECFCVHGSMWRLCGDGLCGGGCVYTRAQGDGVMFWDMCFWGVLL